MVIFKKLFEVYKWKQFSRHLLRSLLPTSQLHWLQQYDVRYINICNNKFLYKNHENIHFENDILIIGINKT